MLTEGWVKFLTAQNTAGVSQEKGVADNLPNNSLWPVAPHMVQADLCLHAKATLRKTKVRIENASWSTSMISDATLEGIGHQRVIV